MRIGYIAFKFKKFKLLQFNPSFKTLCLSALVIFFNANLPAGRDARLNHRARFLRAKQLSYFSGDLFSISFPCQLFGGYTHHPAHIRRRFCTDTLNNRFEDFR